MRSRATNFLQMAILLSGIVYVIVGAWFYVSPLSIIEIFAENISENWLDLVRDHELIAPLYSIARGFAALLFASGAAMVLPLFDPLKYRGLIYYTGILFPLPASLILLKNGFAREVFSDPATVSVAPAAAGAIAHKGHMILIVLGAMFFVLFILTAIGLIVTRRQAHEGVE